MRSLSLVILIAATLPSVPARTIQGERELFADSFESGLDRWELIGEPFVRTQVADDAHRRVLVLTPGGDVLALIKGSEQWGSVRIEGEVRFPTDEDKWKSRMAGAISTSETWTCRSRAEPWGFTLAEVRR